MVIDIIFAIVVAYGFYLGFTKGIIKTIFTILSVLFGLTAAFKFGPMMTDFLETAFSSNNPLMFIAGFLLAFVLTMIVIRLFASGLEGILQSANINILNQVAGGILMGGILVLLYSAILWFADKSNLLNDSSKNQSLTYGILEQYPQQVWKLGGKLKPTFVDFWDHSIDFMDRLEDVGEKNIEQSESDEVYNIDEDTGRRRN
jgi:membrane protein required for colicin V production